MDGIRSFLKKDDDRKAYLYIHSSDARNGEKLTISQEKRSLSASEILEKAKSVRPSDRRKAQRWAGAQCPLHPNRCLWGHGRLVQFPL